MKASLILSPAESKRLIAKGVARLPEVQRALRLAKIIIALGSTNGYVAEELLGERIDKERFIAGFNASASDLTPAEHRLGEIVLIRGRRTGLPPEEVAEGLGPDDVFIKGGNALDPEGTVGVFVGSPDGGTVGRYMRYVIARGVNLIIPIGLEKAVHQRIPKVTQRMGNQEFDLVMSKPIGLWPLHGRVVTEIEALKCLAEVDVFQIGAGGVGGGEGSVILGVEGEEAEVVKAFQLVRALKGETPLSPSGTAD